MKLKKTYTTPASQTLELKLQSTMLSSSPSGSLFLLKNLDGTGDLEGGLDGYVGTSEPHWY